MGGIPWNGTAAEKEEWAKKAAAMMDRGAALTTQHLNAAHDWMDAHDWPMIDREIRIEAMVGKRMRTIRIRLADQVKAPGYMMVYNLRRSVQGMICKGASRAP